MTATKYGQYVKKLAFRDKGSGFYRQVATLDGKDLGMEAYIEYGAYWAPGSMDDEPYRAHTHDFNQVMLWLGGDTNDMGELGAEVEMCLGEEGEKHMVTTTTAVAVPKGMPHFPANITAMNKRFLFLTVGTAADYKETLLPANKKVFDKSPAMMFTSKYRDNILNVSFARKGAWTYGPKNRDDSGGSLAFIRGKDSMFDFLIMCESIKKAPYRFGPEPDKPHVHPRPEILTFIGTDLNDLTKLGAEAEIYLGKEMERHVINAPAAVVIPGELAHCPLVITRVDRPFILTDIRPFGSPPPVPGKL